MSEDDGARLLGPLRSVDVPASGGVSVSRAIRSGKRTKALRVAAAGVFVLIAAGVLPVLIRPDPDPVAMGGFDPLVRTISAGSAGGFTPEVYVTGREKQMIVLRPERGGDQSAGVVVNAARTVGVPQGEAMPDVDGKRALWTGTYLAVEWARDAWAFVTVEGFPDDRERAHRVAQSLRFDEHVQIKVPYTVETSWTLDGVRDTGGDIELVFTNGVRLALRSGVGLAQGEAPQAELEALEKSVRPADPPVTNPFR
ncbi:hypothetical protein C8D87_1021015 [Lentzea atacamensis]|uniref:DUF4245 domain-containing protein n=1 Tax=Lentzea atacamensis TaxID=531938 RepID=A0ABX9EE71_9PSEU|nr:hypothetical protein [Lentzea atacamensis]RAS68937.1 hypothetical protein C8D87_1021015 [Lentzea atacamensis]